MSKNNFYSDKNEYAISTYLFEDFDLETALSEIRSYGFSSVELWADKMVHVDPRLLPDEKKVKELLAENDLSVHSVHLPFRKFREFADRDEGRAYRLNIWKRTLDFCGRLEIPIGVIHACHRSDYNMSNADVPYLHDMLTELADYAKQLGVSLALENIPSGKKPENEILCTGINQHKLFGDIKNLAFCLDIGHVTITSNDMQSEIETIEADRLITFHIHNNDGLFDSHLLPNVGVIDWQKWHDLIRARGFTGQFVLEIAPYGNPFARLKAINELFN